MRIQYLSDIHLEFGRFNFSDSNADVIVAAGDIDQQTEGVEWLKSLDKPVVYVAGNHEIWGGDLQQGIDDLRDSCAHSNVYFLENNQLTMGDVTFFGCTLWVDFDNRDPEVSDYARSQMNDFAYISHDDRELLPEDIIARNEESLRWLKKALGRKTTKKQVVVSHHAPSLRSWGFHPEDMMRFAYCNQLDDIIRSSNISLWIHGHVHCRSDYRIRNTRVVCNPRGYYKNYLVEDFDPKKIVEI